MATKQSMSVTQGLAELKLLNKRLDKFSQAGSWVMMSTKTQPVDAEKLKKQAEADYQSYMALLKRRNAIKQAIVLSNATTRVKIGEWEGTVAEAIEQQMSIQFKQRLLDIMKQMMLSANEQMEEQKKASDARLERLLASELGKDVRTNPETITALTNSFNETNKVELVDPLNLSMKIKALEEEIESFQTNVDWVLSEANGVTLIHI